MSHIMRLLIPLFLLHYIRTPSEIQEFTALPRAFALDIYTKAIFQPVPDSLFAWMRNIYPVWNIWHTLPCPERTKVSNIKETSGTKRYPKNNTLANVSQPRAVIFKTPLLPPPPHGPDLGTLLCFTYNTTIYVQTPW